MAGRYQNGEALEDRLARACLAAYRRESRGLQEKERLIQEFVAVKTRAGMAHSFGPETQRRRFK